MALHRKEKRGPSKQGWTCPFEMTKGIKRTERKYGPFSDANMPNKHGIKNFDKSYY